MTRNSGPTSRRSRIGSAGRRKGPANRGPSSVRGRRMRPPRFETVTISELKRAMDRRFDRLERTKVDKAEFRRAITRLRTGLKRVERTKVDKAEFRRAITGL